MSERTSGLEEQGLHTVEGGQHRFLESGGMRRSYHAFVPPDHDPAHAASLILALHPGASNALRFARVSGLHARAAAAGFVVAYAEGYQGSWNAGDCCGPAKRLGLDDVSFAGAVIDDAQQAFGTDPRRTFVAGFSNGGKLAYRLACELADRVTAIAVVGTGLGVPNCRPSRPVSILHLHGTEDRLHPLLGGVVHVFNQTIDHTSVPDTIETWVDLDGCDQGSEVIYKHGAATCRAYSRCGERAEVVLCQIEGMGHQWPGSTATLPAILGPGTDDISATDFAVGFFAAHERDRLRLNLTLALRGLVARARQAIQGAVRRQ
jgi:polyhydroxybutyrate depolymerase